MSGQQTWKFYLTPPAAWKAMREDCTMAKQSIEIEQYIIENDSVGTDFMDLLLKKAGQGLLITVILDAFGSRSFRNSKIVRRLRQAGGHVYFYNKITWIDIFRPWRWFPRTHLKTLMVDKMIAYTGGVCIAARMIPWRDTQIRITGSVVNKINQDFMQIKRLVQQRKVAPLRHNHNQIRGPFVYMESYPFLSWHLIYQQLLRAIGSAENYIYISTPFFAPNRHFRLLLHKASQRGVDVRLLVPEHSDFDLADWLCLSYAPAMLRRGARIYLYKNSVMHQKTMVIDDRWATIGSTNMDILSFFRNREANLFITELKAVAELKQHFIADIHDSRELTDQILKQQEVWKMVVGYLCRWPKSFLWRT